MSKIVEGRCKTCGHVVASGPDYLIVMSFLAAHEADCVVTHPEDSAELDWRETAYIYAPNFADTHLHADGRSCWLHFPPIPFGSDPFWTFRTHDSPTEQAACLRPHKEIRKAT